MPAPTNPRELFDLVKKSELIPLPRLEAFFAQSKSHCSPREVAAGLVAAGLITQFQAEQFLQGKWRGFTIGKYKVLERLGSGGMGTVYLCEHLMVGRKVAVKVLPTSQATNPSALGRFYREARAAGVLDHPNLVKAHDVDEDGGLHYLVMDYVDGSSLQDVVTRFGPLEVLRACHYVRLAARGLQAAHEAGLVHRDVKPANLMVERNGNVRVLDLGLARFFNDDADLLTLKYDERNVLGTADYVSPEQALNSHEVDGRTDTYSLGATFYFLLTGQPPFPTGKIAQKLIWHQVRQPTPVRDLRAEVPEGVAAIVAKMLEKEPQKRYQTPAEVIEALTPFTCEPLAPPREEEMPRLSPAAAAAAAPSNGSTPPTREVRLPTANRGAATGTMPRTAAPGPAPSVAAAAVAHGSSNRMVALGKTPGVPSEMGTPRTLSSHVPTRTQEPRPTAPASPAVSPSQLIEQAAEPKASGWMGFVLLFVLLVLVGGLAGVAATWWLFGR